jgi:hypothetical protein
MGLNRYNLPDLPIRRIISLSFLLLFFLGASDLYSVQVSDSLTVQTTDTVYHLSHNDLRMGERLFYGLIREQQDQESCVSCHNIKPASKLDWNPSALDIASAIHTDSPDELKRMLQNPTGKKMTEAHSDYGTLSDEQIILLKAYLLDFYQQGGYPGRPVINKLLIYLALTVVFLLALLDLIWLRTVRFRLIHAIVLFSAALLLSRYTVEEAIAVGRSKNYEPDQPVKFSHTVHAGQNQTNCLYCHSNAEYGKSAGIPSAGLCLNCHMIVREGNRSGRFEINKIFAAVEQKQLIKWTRVYNLPDHVFFSHAQHVGAGKIDCLACHGDVMKMDRIVQVIDMSMGWCINCHRTTGVQFHDNTFYTSYEAMRKKVENGEISQVTVEHVGGTDCMKCHY